MYADKSMDLQPLMRIFNPWLEERFIVLHSLQVGPDSSQLQQWSQHRGVVDLRNLEDFFDTACGLVNLSCD